jgi:prepilin peptidase CpaA
VAVGNGCPIPTSHLSVTSARERAVQTAVLVVGIGILAIIAYGDVCTRRIPNALSVAIAMLGLLRMILLHDPAAASRTLAAAAAVFVAAFLLFWRGAIGGGDAKLVPAMALLIGYHELLSFLFLMSLGGGALALAILARDKLRPRLLHLPRLESMPSAKIPGCSVAPARSTVPYGVAIAAAGVITLILEASFTK